MARLALQEESDSPRLALPQISWDERLLGRIGGHIAFEENARITYDWLAEIGNPQIRFFADLIAADGVYHHEMLSTLTGSGEEPADQDRVESGRTTGPPPTAERRHLLRKTVRELLAIERRDVTELKELRRDMRSAPEATMWSVIVEIMVCDTEKHVRILRAIQRGLSRPEGTPGASRTGSRAR